LPAAVALHGYFLTTRTGNSANGRLVVGNLIDAWTMKLDAARKTDSWPKISVGTFS
jgi:hypothetical protein